VKQKLQKIISLIGKPSEFTKNIVTVFSGTAFTQIIPILTAPILTRLYSPTDYGLLGILMIIAGIISVFATFGYINAIIVAENESDAEQVIALCYQSLTLVVLSSTFLVLLFGSYICEYFKITEYKYTVYLVPIFVLMSGLSNIVSFVATRYQLFGKLTVNRIISAVANAIVSITLGFVVGNFLGLLVGFMVGQFINSMLLYTAVRRAKNLPDIMQYLRQRTKTIAQKFVKFPKYVLSSDFINYFTSQIPVFSLSSFLINPHSAVGHYNMSNRMLGLPINFIANSIAEVFRQRAAADYNQLGTCKPIFLKTFKALFLTAVVPFAILIFFGGPIFAFTFGEEWRQSGTYSQILGIMFFLKFIVSPLTYVFYVAHQQKLDFYLHLLFLIIGFGTLYFGLVIEKSINNSLWYFSIGNSVIYIIYFIFSIKFCNNVSSRQA
jgi:O-antigen/teichoic acid export membrane protein